MTKVTKPAENLPSTMVANSFLASNGSSEIEFASDIASEITPEDYEGYETPAMKFPWVKIRQKGLKDDRGKEIKPAGNFAMTDKAVDGIEIIPDVDGSVGLILTMIADVRSRALWINLTDPVPACKSGNGIRGVGNPGGVCESCPLSQWNNDASNENDRRPKCSTNYNVLCYDHQMKACYILTLGRSGIAPFDNFKRLVSKAKMKVQGKMMPVPLHYLTIRIVTEFKQDKGEYFVPKFSVVEPINDRDLLKSIKDAREAAMAQFRGTVQDTTLRDEDLDASQLDPNLEVPEGVTPINYNKAEAGDDAMPF